MKTKNKVKFEWTNLFWIIELIISLYFLYITKKANILPMKYYLPIMAVILLFSGLFIFIARSRRTYRYVKIFSNVLCVILSLALIVGGLAVKKGYDTLLSIANNQYQSSRISVVVLNDSEIQDENNLIGKKIGAQVKMDIQNTEYLVKDLTKKLNTAINTQPYDNPTVMYEALKNKQIDALILSEGYRERYKEIDPDFNTNTRIVYQIERLTDLSKITKRVDVTEQPFNIYISGIDIAGDISQTSNSDVNMILTVNPKTKKILMTNTPRDYYVQVSCYDWQRDKLTHCGVYGLDCSVGTLEHLYGTTLNYYVRVNFTSVKTMVDAIGGINVYSDYAFQDFHVGNNYLNGERALRFARERHAFQDGDRQRGKNQQKIVEAMITKMMSPALLTNYTGIMNAISGTFETNMTSGEITDLIQMQLNDMSSWTFEKQSVDGSNSSAVTFGSGGQVLYVMEPNRATVDEAVRKINEVLSGN